MSSLKPGRLKVGVIGPGKVGVIVARALQNAQHEIIGVTASTRPENTDRVEALLPGVPTFDATEICALADLVLVTVPDDQIRPVVNGLARLKAWRPGQIVAHFSGAHGLDVLADATAAGVLALALHPAMTFSGYSLDLQRLDNCPAAVTACAVAQPIGQALLIEMGCQPQIVADEHRALYHAALSHGANHLNTLVVQALGLLEKTGVDDSAAYLKPLLEAALERALAEGTAGLTGPVARADVGTLQTHLQVIAPSSVKETYRGLAQATADLAYSAGRLHASQYQQVQKILDGE